MSGAAANDQGGPGRSDGFGPFHTLASLTDVQRRGMEAASQVIKGFIDLLDVEAPPRPADPDVAPVDDHQPGFAQLRINVARALDLYTDLVRRSFESYADLMEQTLRARGVHLKAADDGQLGLLTVQGAAGAEAAGTLWMHNTTDRPASAALRLTDLTAHDGLAVPASAGRFEPTALNIGPGVSVSARLALALGDVEPGVYRGHVLAGGLPDLALPIRLVVTEMASGPPA
jgi:hypothetical protein